MYTFVYRTFIKFILFCRGQALEPSMPSRAWVVTLKNRIIYREKTFQCPHGLELLQRSYCFAAEEDLFQCPHGLELLRGISPTFCVDVMKFQCPHGLELLQGIDCRHRAHEAVSMPSRAWVVTARMSNILNFLWYFLCIPAIYKCILAYLPIFSTNYLSFWGANPLVLFWELAFRTTLLSFYW